MEEISTGCDLIPAELFRAGLRTTAPYEKDKFLKSVWKKEKIHQQRKESGSYILIRKVTKQTVEIVEPFFL